jgi:transposase
VIAIYEAGWSGFWLVRWLATYGIETHVIQPSSVPIDRRARRAKSDGIDADLLLRTLLAWLRGEPRVCSMVPIPAEADEDARRRVRERAELVAERIGLVNRIGAVLATLGMAYTTRYGGIGANVSTNCGRRSGIHCPRTLARRSPACSIV